MRPDPVDVRDLEMISRAFGELFTDPEVAPKMGRQVSCDQAEVIGDMLALHCGAGARKSWLEHHGASDDPETDLHAGNRAQPGRTRSGAGEGPLGVFLSR